MYPYLLVLLLASIVSIVFAAPTLNIKRSLQSTPALTEDFPDPCIIKVGNTWHAFASQAGGTGHGSTHVQHATSDDFSSWTYDDGNDALPNLPAWVNAGSPNVWAPSVIQRDDGQFVLYYSATAADLTGNGATHCLGTATSDNVAGPYTPTSDSPFTCPLDVGGAIDPGGFQDSDGARYLVYKIDGNSVGQDTPILLQQLQSDAVTATGNAAVEIFRNGPADSGIVEAPTIIKADDGTYFTFFSSAGYCSTAYDVSYAYASSVAGPWTKASQPLLLTGDSGLLGPGGLGVGPSDSTHVALHSWTSESAVCGDPGRYMYVGEISISGNSVTI